MRKLLVAEVAALLVLLVVAVGVRLSAGQSPSQPSLNSQPSESQSTEATQVLGPGFSEPTEATAPAQTEPTWATLPAGLELKAQQYFVYDITAQEYLACSGTPQDQVYPASITKLFTAYVAMQYVDPQKEITAGDVLDLVAWGSSVAKIKKGDTLTAGQLVEAMLLPSGNDAAYMLACEAGRVMKGNPNLSPSAAVQAFMTQMNAQAKAVGMTNTHFVNPDGIHDSQHYTTFADLAILGKLSMENETIMKHAITPNKDVQLHGETITWKNTNALVNPTTEYYCPYAVGLKTGQTPSAGSCLLSAFRKGDTELIIGVFGCPEEEDRFDDTLQLFNQIVLK